MVPTNLTPPIFSIYQSRAHDVQDLTQVPHEQINDLNELITISYKQPTYVPAHVRRGYESETRSLDGEADDEHEFPKRVQTLTGADIHRIYQDF